jgi:malonyl CoA-acyl carrier protein transacylase
MRHSHKIVIPEIGAEEEVIRQTTVTSEDVAVEAVITVSIVLTEILQEMGNSQVPMLRLLLVDNQLVVTVFEE